jgi:hypothetical protein
MDNEELRELFCLKISMELARYKRKMLRQKPEYIFHNAYQIDCIINIYESLLEMSQKIGKRVLKTMLVFPNLLIFLYRRWLKWQDSSTEELEICLEQEIMAIEDAYERISGEMEVIAA